VKLDLLQHSVHFFNQPKPQSRDYKIPFVLLILAEMDNALSISASNKQALTALP